MPTLIIDNYDSLKAQALLNAFSPKLS